MNKAICPYCKLETNLVYSENNLDFYCNNHNDVIVILPSFSDKFHWLQYNNRYSIYIYPTKLKMRIITWSGDTISNGTMQDIPFDSSLTPKNFHDKIKLYLTFQ
jgi:hypothetical protein